MSRRRVSRRRLLKSLGTVSAASLFQTRAGAQGLVNDGPCPQLAGKVVRWIVPRSPGGGFDIYSRLIEPFYEAKIGAEVVVENLPGGAGIVGARTLSEAKPDGLTQGILNAPGLLVAALTGETRAPNPLTRFTILGRVARNQPVWFTAGRSPFQSIDQVLSEAQRRSIVFGVPEVGSTNFVAIAITSFLLGINAEFVAGFSGSRETSLAVLRGDVDIGSFNFESVLDRIETGDLRPLLQVSAEHVSGHPSLQDAPLLGGNAGVAARQALKLGRDIERATADAGAVAELTGAGRLVAAPLGLEKSLARCLELRLHEALTDPAFETAATAASRSLNVARAGVARADLQAAAERAQRFIPIVRETIRRLRG